MISRADSSDAESSTSVERIVTVSLDDGLRSDLEAAKLLQEHKLKATFYVLPPLVEVPTMDEKEIRGLSRRFEIGAHTVNHPNLTTIAASRARREILDSKKILEEICGTRIQMFCYPYGECNRDVVAMVRDAGFIGARTGVQFCIEKPTDPYRFATTILVYQAERIKKLVRMTRLLDFKGLLRFCESGSLKSWLAHARHFFDEVYEHGGIFHIWCHSWEIEELKLWEEFEELLEYVSERESTNYMTNGEIIRAVLSDCRHLTNGPRTTS